MVEQARELRKVLRCEAAPEAGKFRPRQAGVSPLIPSGVSVLIPPGSVRIVSSPISDQLIPGAAL